MANKLDLYDINKLKEARKLICKVSEYNYFPGSSLTKRLETILNKLDKIIQRGEEEYAKQQKIKVRGKI